MWGARQPWFRGAGMRGLETAVFWVHPYETRGSKSLYHVAVELAGGQACGRGGIGSRIAGEHGDGVAGRAKRGRTSTLTHTSPGDAGAGPGAASAQCRSQHRSAPSATADYAGAGAAIPGARHHHAAECANNVERRSPGKCKRGRGAAAGDPIRPAGNRRYEANAAGPTGALHQSLADPAADRRYHISPGPRRIIATPAVFGYSAASMAANRKTPRCRPKPCHYRSTVFLGST